jgi:aminoglycoside phosphotransferase (APT) family kinase protein
MLPAKDVQKYIRIMEKFDPEAMLIRAWKLEGGVSAQVMALEIEQADGQTKKLLVRQHGEVDRTQNPQIAADEFKLLDLLHAAGLPVPAPYYLDQSCEIFPIPYIVIEYIEGESIFTLDAVPDLIPQLAAQLARIHKLDGSRQDFSFLPQQAKIYADKLGTRPARLDDSLDEGHIRDVLEAVGPLPLRNKSVLLHGDFWPGNILWRDGRLVGVIDWEDARLGDPLSDLANSRLETLWAFGREAMQRFTQCYLTTTGIDATLLPYWDLYAALKPALRLAEWAGDAVVEKRWREEHRWFITQAFETS